MSGITFSHCVNATNIILGYLEGEDDPDFVGSVVERVLRERVQPNPTFLHWTQRPPKVCRAIEEAFASLSSRKGSFWAFNGGDQYELCGISDPKLLKTIIQQAPSDQKDFYVVDLGAGKFQLGKALANFVDAQADLPPDITVHILSVRGEQNTDEAPIKSTRCIRHNCGSFKIEEFERELSNRKLGFKGKIDLIFTRWCMTHLIDPAGTFKQCIDCMRRNGIFAGDAFSFGDETGGSSDVTETNIRMVDLLQDQQNPFLVQRYKNPDRADQWSTNRFIIKKLDSTPCDLPMQYVGLQDSHLTQFKRADGLRRQPISWSISSETSLGMLSGSRSLFNWLKKSELIGEDVDSAGSAFEKPRKGDSL